MNIKFITLALAVIATTNLFGDHGSRGKPYQCKMSGNELEADIVI